MASFKTINLDLPARNEDLSNLEIGSVAYLSGRIFTAREGVYQRAIEDGAGMPASRDALGLANFHCSPAAAVNPDGSYTVGAVTATASFRFAKWLDGWFQLSGCNIIIGKGGMTSEVYRRYGCAARPRHQARRRSLLAGRAGAGAGRVGARCGQVRAVPGRERSRRQ